MYDVKLNDLNRLHSDMRNDLTLAYAEVLNESDFIQGNNVLEFENRFSEFVGTKFCVSCANGTDALVIALRSLDLKSGDEVIIPAISWISTASAVVLAGGKPVICDVCEDTVLLDTDQLDACITERTVGLIPVHLYGQPVEMDAVVHVANKYNLWIVEDCAQAHGAQYRNKAVGTIGDIGTFSFYPGKNLGALGDAGAITTNCPKLYDTAKKFSLHGQVSKGNFEFVGLNSRMDALQAKILLLKLKKLQGHNEKRREVAGRYLNEINNELVRFLRQTCSSEHVFHQFVIRVEDREPFQRYLKEKKIETGNHYSFSLSGIDFLNENGVYKCPNAERLKGEVVSLPMHPFLLDGEVTHIVKCINEYK